MNHFVLRGKQPDMTASWASRSHLPDLAPAFLSLRTATPEGQESLGSRKGGDLQVRSTSLAVPVLASNFPPSLMYHAAA